MAAPESMFLLSDAVQAVRLTDFLHHDQIVVTPPPVQGPSLPITPDGTMQAGQLYPDESNPALQWYLPAYAVNVVDGRYSSRLKWRGPDDDPNGPIAFLTVELTAPAPGVPGPTLAEIPHTAVVRLAYELPVEGSGVSAVGATLYVEVGALAVQASGVRSCRLPITTKADFDRLYAVMTEAKMNGRLEIHCSATLGQRVQQTVWHVIDPILVSTDHVPRRDPPVIVDDPPIRVRRPPRGDHPPILEPLVSPTATPVGQVELATEVSPALEARAEMPLSQFADVRRVVALSEVDVSPAVRQPLSRSAMPALRRIEDDGGSDIRFSPRPVELGPRFPLRPGSTDGGFETVTTTVQVAAEAVQAVGFNFPVNTNAYMFDIPGDLVPSTTNEILIPNSVIVDGRVTTFYQDSAYPDRFYFAPQELRLARSDTPPYLPRLRFTFELAAPAPVSGDSGGDADPAPLDYEVRVAFEATPWISPLTLAEIRQLVAKGPDTAQFVPLAPLTVALSLRLPDGHGGPLVSSSQLAASVSLDRGITNELALSPEQFKSVVAALTTTGIDGNVTATLIGSTTTDVPVSLSLARSAGHVFSRALQAGSTPGTYLVTLTNDIESTVTVHAAHVGLLAPGVIATPEPVVPVDVAPHGTISLAYTVQPSSATVLDIEPDLDVTIGADPAKVLPLLMVAEGYRSDTFTVPVSTDAAYFAAPVVDGAVLAAVLVEFDSGPRVALDPTALSAPVVLHMPWLPYLLDAPEAKQYKYRVTSAWAADPSPIAGSTGPWVEGSGEAELAIVPNPPDPPAPPAPAPPPADPETPA